MINLKKNSDSDIESLIESMLRLMEYMNQNPSFKRKMFESFNHEDLNKIQKNLNDKKNITLRKISCLFLCCILQNEENCESFLKLSDLIPINSKIALNGIPERISKYVSNDTILKLQNAQFSENSLCWYYTYQMAKEQLPYLQFFSLNYLDIRKSINDFVDPLDSIIGIVYEKYKMSKPITTSNDISKRDKRSQMQKLSVSPMTKQQQMGCTINNVSQEKYQKRYVISKVQQFNQSHKQQDNSTERKSVNYDVLRNKILEQQQNTRTAIVNQKPYKEIQSTSMEMKLRLLKNQ
ncbi:unnamed protein product (macronuclear) [Paramecium tetraurelia]|uniref:PUB domain-containing protein n=1 Tax=Paramecium tetraurelia TaxID=5888 RepID=A0E963_PARTE|nr:uncharacterized protein GSPATT00024561001 [Paramecium tetraurelia]CAK91830.1 unnamed protein product [Paramecium tetraurelia]|eukprot:XP_001459227.1 hypothetical protein (macronuclear) [Paramecium tetraurelia strain d4-2]